MFMKIPGMFKKLTGKKSEREKSAPRNSRKGKEQNSSLNMKSVFADLTTARSILSKMVAMFLLLIIVPVTTIGFIATRTSSENLTKSAEDSLSTATDLTSRYFDVFIEKAESISMQIIASSVIQQFSRIVDEDISSYDALTLHQDASSVVSNLNASTSDMTAMVLYTNGKVLGDSNVRPEDMSKLMESGWYKKAKEANGKTVLIERSEGFSGTSTENFAMSIVRTYKDVASGPEMGVVIVDIKDTSVMKILKSIDLGLADATYLITPDEKVIAGNDDADPDELAQKQFVKDAIQHAGISESGLFYSTDKDVRCLVSFKKSPAHGFISLTVVPNSSITAGTTQIAKTTTFAGVIFGVLAIIFGFIFSLRMTIAMKSIMGVMAKAEEGDLTVSLAMKRRDEIGKLVASFNKMTEKIRELVSQSKNAADEVASTSEKMASISSESSRVSNEIAHAIVEVASGSSNQATEVEASVKNVSQLADRISQAVEKTKAMEADAGTMREISDYGIATIDNLNRKTAETNELATSVVNEIAQLNQYVKNINVITNVLRSIADQTNLLALNAAIEAARAGESGKGFAVVADEIRKLAEQSNNHTREIQKHIENVFKQTQGSTEIVGKTEKSIKEQSEMVAVTAEAFAKINSTTVSLAENIKNVGEMIKGMDSYKEKVMASMENISAVSQQVSASTEEVSASTEQQLASIEQLDDMAKKLYELAENLISQMEKFKI